MYSLRDLQQLHRQHAPSDKVYRLVFEHCQIVWQIAEQLIEAHSLQVDQQLVRVGCLLHDIGVYPLLDIDANVRSDTAYITHGTAGEAILREAGFPNIICRFASHHTGVGLSKEDIIKQQLSLPAADYLAETDEELLIMYADKFHSKTNPPYFNSFEWYKNEVARFGSDKVARFEQMAQQFGLPDLEPLASKYGYAIR